MRPEDLLELLLIAADAKTEEQRIRIAWRALDHMWREYPRYNINLCRDFKNLCSNKGWPKKERLWSIEEKLEILRKYRVPKLEQAPKLKQGLLSIKNLD